MALQWCSRRACPCQSHQCHPDRSAPRKPAGLCLVLSALLRAGFSPSSSSHLRNSLLCSPMLASKTSWADSNTHVFMTKFRNWHIIQNLILLGSWLIVSLFTPAASGVHVRCRSAVAVKICNYTSYDALFELILVMLLFLDLKNSLVLYVYIYIYIYHLLFSKLFSMFAIILVLR